MTEDERKKRTEACAKLLAAEVDFLTSVGWVITESDGYTTFWRKGGRHLSQGGAILRVRSEERLYRLSVDREVEPE